TITLRAFGSALSLVIREFMERSFEIRACEQTLSEVIANTPAALRKALPTLPRERVETTTEQLQRLLRFCNEITFSDTAELKVSLKHRALPEALKRSKT